MHSRLAHASPQGLLHANRGRAPIAYLECALAFGGPEHYAWRRAGPGAISPFVHG